MITIPLDALPGTVRQQLQRLRPIGLCEGQFVVPDSFFDPLPEDVQKAFEGEASNP